jgi:LmbE family N-acetylglucosaminyl deacetylase
MIPQKPLLLAVLAHPDDETFGMGGTLALYARRGVSIHLACATRGEAGEVDPQFLQGFSSIADRRVSELRCAAGVLGIEGIHFLGYRDSGMPGSADNQNPQALVQAPVDEVVAKIVHLIRSLRPQVVVTFDPIGGYRHPDHIAIHNAAVRAFSAAGDPNQFPDDMEPYSPQKLYFNVIPHNFLRLAVRLMPLIGRDPRHIGRNKDIDLVSIVEVKFPVNASIDYRSVAKIRDEAAACHASQGGSSLTPGFLAWLRRELASKETYMLAYPAPNDGKIEHDLFAGVQIPSGGLSRAGSPAD